MFTYYIRSGALLRPDGSLISICHSGYGDAMNDPSRCYEKNVGPLPPGFYAIGPAYHHPHLGPVTMNLDPLPGTDMRGRGSIRIHGANATPDPSDDSHGCVVDGRDGRLELAASLDRILEVVPERPESQPLEPVVVEAEPTGPSGPKES